MFFERNADNKLIPFHRLISFFQLPSTMHSIISFSIPSSHITLPIAFYRAQYYLLFHSIVSSHSSNCLLPCTVLSTFLFHRLISLFQLPSTIHSIISFSMPSSHLTLPIAFYHAEYHLIFHSIVSAHSSNCLLPCTVLSPFPFHRLISLFQLPSTMHSIISFSIPSSHLTLPIAFYHAQYHILFHAIVSSHSSNCLLTCTVSSPFPCHRLISLFQLPSTMHSIISFSIPSSHLTLPIAFYHEPYHLLFTFHRLISLFQLSSTMHSIISFSIPSSHLTLPIAFYHAQYHLLFHSIVSSHSSNCLLPCTVSSTFQFHRLISLFQLPSTMHSIISFSIPSSHLTLPIVFYHVQYHLLFHSIVSSHSSSCLLPCTVFSPFPFHRVISLLKLPYTMHSIISFSIPSYHLTLPIAFYHAQYHLLFHSIVPSHSSNCLLPCTVSSPFPFHRLISFFQLPSTVHSIISFSIPSSHLILTIAFYNAQYRLLFHSIVSSHSYNRLLPCTVSSPFPFHRLTALFDQSMTVSFCCHFKCA